MSANKSNIARKPSPQMEDDDKETTGSEYEESSTDSSTEGEDESGDVDSGKNDNAINKKKASIFKKMPSKLRRYQKAKKGIITHKKHCFIFNVQEKIYILNEAKRVNNKSTTAKKYGIDSRHIRGWNANYKKLKEKAEKNPKAKTCNKGKKAEYDKLEAQLNDWFEEMQLTDTPVRTNNIIKRAVQLDKNFKNGNKKRMERWVYCFMERYKLSVRRVTRIGQKLSGHLKEVQKETVLAINKRFSIGGSLETVDPKFFINMDQTAIHFELKSKSVVARKGAKTVACKDSGSNAKRLTLVVAIAADGTKLPPFFIFKAKPNAQVEQKLLADGVKGCCQKNAWWDHEVAEKWVRLVLRPYMEENGGQLGLLLVDHFKCHLLPSFTDVCNGAGFDVDYIPKGYTCVLQPVDVGFNAPLKKWVRDYHHEWCLEKYPLLTKHQKVPLPSNAEIMMWIHKAYGNITRQSIINTFNHIGYNVPKSPTTVVIPEMESETVSDVTADTGFTDEDSDVIDYRDIFLRKVHEDNEYEIDEDEDDEDNDEEKEPNDDNYDKYEDE